MILTAAAVCLAQSGGQPYSLRGEWRQRSGGDNGATWNTRLYGIEGRDILLVFDGANLGSYRFRGGRNTSCGRGVDVLESGTFRMNEGRVTLSPDVSASGCWPTRTYTVRLSPDPLDPNILELALTNNAGTAVFSREMSAYERQWVVTGECSFQASSYANNKECGGFSVDSDGAYLSLRDRQGERTNEGGPGVDPHYRMSDIPAGIWITPLNFARRPLPVAIMRSGNQFRLRVGDQQIQSARMTPCEPTSTCRTQILGLGGVTGGLAAPSVQGQSGGGISAQQFVGVWQPRGSRASLELRGNGSLVFRAPTGAASQGNWSFDGSALRINSGAPCPLVSLGSEGGGPVVMRIVCQGNEQVWFRTTQ